MGRPRILIGDRCCHKAIAMDVGMKTILKFALVAGVLAVAGCSKPQGGGYVNDPYANGGYGAGGVGAGSLGGPGNVDYFRGTIGDTVNFLHDQSVLTPEARTTLTNQAQWMNANQSFSAVIEGHADEKGTREYNLALGARRASSVQEYLISQGVSGNRLRTVSYGKERPLAVCSTEDCFFKNRRSVTAVSPGVGS